jgi:hypothetical protein
MEEFPSWQTVLAFYNIIQFLQLEQLASSTRLHVGTEACQAGPLLRRKHDITEACVYL